MKSKKIVPQLIIALLIFASPILSDDFFTAIRQGNTEKVNAVLEKDPGLVNRRQWGIYPLHFAVRAGKIKIAELLISKGAEINRFAKDVTEFAPFEFTPMTDAIRVGNFEMVKMFAEKGADLKKVTSLGESYLHFAAFMNRREIAAYLIAKGIDVNIKKRGDLTPLHIAAVTGHLEVAELLIKQGSDLDAMSTDGGTPLHFARAAAKEKVAELLKSKGARDLPRKFPKYSGAYLGIKSPGKSPAPFAPELFRDIYRVHSVLAFSPNGREVFWECIFMLGNNDVSRVWTMKERGGRWTEPRVASFSRYPSGGPAFFHHGKKLVYSSMRPRSDSGEPANDLDLWMVEKSGNTWGPPKHVNTPLNQNKTMEVLPMVAGDGTIYLRTGPGAYVKSAVINGEYSAVEVIGDLFDTKYVDTCNAMDHILLFSDKRRQERFEYEIFISFHKADGRWSKPLYLGDKLHPGRRATTAIVTIDRKYLFFVSNFYNYWVDAKIIEELKPKELQ
jgi:ankyrin repeat protein